MIKNLCYAVPTIGRISIGEIVENNDRRLPRKINHFRITAMHKRDGQWVEHPVAKAIAARQKVEVGKITEIPVKVMFNDPALTLRERYEAFDNMGRTVCAGNGDTGKRMVGGTIEQVPCPGADRCEFGKASRCALMTRANFLIDVEAENYAADGFSAFILRSRGYNTSRILNRKLNYFAAMFGKKLVGVPFVLKLRMKSSAGSKNTPFYYVDLVLATGLKEAMGAAKAEAEARQALGLDQDALEAEVRKGLENGPFEDGEEEAAELEEFLLGDDGQPKTKTTTEGSGEIVVLGNAPAIPAPDVAGSMGSLLALIESTRTESTRSAEAKAV